MSRSTWPIWHCAVQACTIGVSRLHGEISRQIFQPLFPRWPACEVPVGQITNGVHVPTWDSAEADRLWTKSLGKERWRLPPAIGFDGIAGVSDQELWAMRGKSRNRVVRVARRYLTTQLRGRGLALGAVREADTVLDANVLTLGFARQFTEYKRPNLLLSDPNRFAQLLLNEKRPVQIVVAGKAHPADIMGKDMIREWIEFARQPRFRRSVIFLEDYDIDLAQELVQGVDVWINTPRRPWEACGTSGMKVLVNGDSIARSSMAGGMKLMTQSWGGWLATDSVAQSKKSTRVTQRASTKSWKQRSFLNSTTATLRECRVRGCNGFEEHVDADARVQHDAHDAGVP